MRAGIRAPFVDTRAADLTWTLGHAPIAPLATRVVRAGPAFAELRVLGASHQVRAGISDDGPETLLETVACLPGASGALPERATADVDGASRYLFASTVETLAPGEFTARVTRLSRAISAHPDGLLATFPGDLLAITAMAVIAGPAEREPLSWRTWHAYPQSGELVTTTTSIALGRPHPRSRGQTNG
ncbi:DUF2617 family protein [Allosalinactinospora lopnorensis]|uniref:DUF2617 family protein n=1 Tax=Allosalinactinospora lopnorensis TaxID=1352348 RepID=UPI000623D6AD|nr:DUF2617 family protein [Allosalinactinospora lopnorensis]